MQPGYGAQNMSSFGGRVRVDQLAAFENFYSVKKLDTQIWDKSFETPEEIIEATYYQMGPTKSS